MHASIYYFIPFAIRIIINFSFIILNSATLKEACRETQIQITKENKEKRV